MVQCTLQLFSGLKAALSLHVAVSLAFKLPATSRFTMHMLLIYSMSTKPVPW